MVLVQYLVRTLSCGSGYHGRVAAEQVTIDDPRVLRAIAHPVRMKMLDLFETEGSQRATDIAQALDIPANQASFHLRQLAKYGLVVEAPEEARDGRDRVWKLASKTLNIDARRLARTAGGRAALDVFRAQWAPQAYGVIDRVIDHGTAAPRAEGEVAAAIDQVLRLTHGEARTFLDEVRALIERWADRTERADDAVGYEILLAVVPEARKDQD